MRPQGDCLSWRAAGPGVHELAGRRSGAAAESQASSSIGRAPVSKTGGWGFDPLRACLLSRFGGGSGIDD